MTKLTVRQICQLHTMHRDGHPNYEIARALQINRNSVSAHLAGDITYTASVYKKIGMKAPLVCEGWLTMRQAAPWIPGHPSRARMQTLIQGRSWVGRETPKLQSELREGRRRTRIEWIAEFLQQVYPEGIWISKRAMAAELPPSVLKSIPMAKLGWIKGTDQPFGDQFIAAPLCVASRIVQQHSCQLNHAPLVIHRATTVHRHVGVAVIA